MSKTHLAELSKILSIIFKKKINLKVNSNKTDIQNWDSLADVKIILAIEKKLKKKININLFINAKKISDIIKLISK
jgi:acyl carrier protein